MACDGYSIWLSMRFFKFYLGGITTRQFFSIFLIFYFWHARIYLRIRLWYLLFLMGYLRFLNHINDLRLGKVL